MPQTKQTEATPTRAAKPGKKETRREQLMRMLRRKAGADVPAISAKMGWQAHSTRAALSGLRKAGFELEAAKPERGGPSRYRIVKEPESAAS